MDGLPRHATGAMDDSPAAAVKTRTRIKRKRASLQDNEPRAAPKRKYSRRKGPAESKLGGQAGGPELTGDIQQYFCSTRVEAHTKPSPPPTPLFGFDSPDESWSPWPRASETSSPTNSVQFRRHSANFYSSFEPNVPSIPIDDRNKSSGENIVLGSRYVSPARIGCTPGGLMNNAEPFAPGKRYSFATTPTPIKAGNFAMEPHTNPSASEAMCSGVNSREHHMDDSNVDFMTQSRVNQEAQVNGLSCRPSNTGSSPARTIYESSHPFSLPSKNFPQTRIHPTESLDMTFEALESDLATEWQPAGLLSMDSQEPENQYALLVLNQPIQNLNMLRLIWGKAFFRIAADGGANRLSDAFKDPCLNEDYKKIGLEVICGDLDSLFNRVRERAQRKGTKIVEDSDQNSTDFTKCILYLRENVFNRRCSVSNIVCLGGLGGRVDQALSQLHHLYMEQQDPYYKNGRIYLLSTEGISFVLKKGKHRIRVRDTTAPVLGKHIGIIPLKEPSTITTKGLEWDVTDWPTEFGGQISTSNHVREDVVEITTSGDVLFTIDLNFPPGNHEHPELKRELTPVISMEDDIFFGIEINPYSYQINPDAYVEMIALRGGA